MTKFFSRRDDFLRLLPPRPATTGDRHRGGLIAAALFAIVFASLIRLDPVVLTWLQTLGAPFNHPIVSVFRRFAEVRFLAALCVLILVADRRGAGVVAHLLWAMYLGFNMMCLGKLLIHRNRPARFESFEALNWTASWHGIDVDFSRAIGNAMEAAMPSGHTYAAFTIAIVLGWFYPRARVTFLLLATGTACSRILQYAHWPSDCLAGAAIGYIAAWLSLRTRLLTTPRRWFRSTVRG